MNSTNISHPEILNPNEIGEFQDLVFCQICYELNTPERKAVICKVCQNIAFCSACFKECMSKDKKCPFCRTLNPEVKSINDSKMIKKILGKVKLSCDLKFKGCHEAITLLEYQKHKKDCGSCQFCRTDVIKAEKKTHFSVCNEYLRQCPLCNKTRTKGHLVTEHFCKRMLYQNDYEKKRQLLTPNRIKIENSKQKLLDQVKCSECNFVARKPQECMNCLRLYCTLCTERNNGFCQKCKFDNILEGDIEEYLKQILQQIDVRCIHCSQWYNYTEIDIHELQCIKCLYCDSRRRSNKTLIEHLMDDCQNSQIFCITCHQTLKKKDFIKHDCETEEKRQERQLEQEAQVNIRRHQGVFQCFKNAYRKDNFKLIIYLLMILPIAVGDHISEYLTYQHFIGNNLETMLLVIGVLQDYIITFIVRMIWLMGYFKSDDNSLLKNYNEVENKMTASKYLMALIFTTILPYSEGIVHNGLQTLKNGDIISQKLLTSRCVTSLLRIGLVFTAIGMTSKTHFDIFEIYTLVLGTLHAVIICFWSYISTSNQRKMMHDLDTEKNIL